MGEVAVKETAAVTPVNNKVMAAPTSASYIARILQSIKEDFIAVNEGMDFDFVNIGTWMSIDKKGNFVVKDQDKVVVSEFGDTLDVVVGKGEKRYMLWGEADSPEDGILITAKPTLEEAERQLEEFLEEHPDAKERYCADDIKLTYLAYIVPVFTLSSDEDMPEIYLMAFSQTTTFSWGNYSKNVFLGKFKKIGIPARTAVNQIVTRLTTVEKSSKTNANNSWIGIKFEPVGMFNPEDYKVANMGQGAEEDVPF